MTVLDAPGSWVSRHRTPVITAVCGAVGVLFALAGVGFPWSLYATPPAIGVTVAFLVVISAVHLGRRRRPLTALALGALVALTEVLVTGGSGLGVLIVLSDLTYAAALYSSSRIVDVVAFASTALALGGAVLLAIAWTTGDGVDQGPVAGAVLPGALVTAPVAFASSIWLGRMVRAPRLDAQRERERADTVERAAAALRQDAVTRERLELSRELHDVIAGHLSAIAMQSTAALERRALDDAEPLRRSLELVRGSSLDALADMRTMIDVLRGDPLDETSTRTPDRLTEEGIARAVAVAEANGLEVDLDVVGGTALAEVPAPTSVVGLRTLVEGLTNAAKHAPGSSARVAVGVDAGTLSVIVTNPAVDGTPNRPPSGSGGVGLVGLAERARLVGGMLTAGPAGSTWEIALTAPYDPIAGADRPDVVGAGPAGVVS